MGRAGRGGAGRRAPAGGAVALLAGLAGLGLGRGYEITDEMKLEYARNGAIILRGVVPRLRDYANGIRHAWAQGVRQFAHSESERIGCGEHYTRDIPPPTYSKGQTLDLSDEAVEEEINWALHSLWMAEKCSEEVQDADNFTMGENATHGAQLQYFQAVNLAAFNDMAAEWVFGEEAELGKISTELLGVPSTRLYQDGFFRKGDTAGSKIRILNDPTNIHRDLDMAPVEADIHGTFWCPLHAIDTRKTTALFFMKGSHNSVEGLDFSHSLSRYIQNRLDETEVDTPSPKGRWKGLPEGVGRVLEEVDALLPKKLRYGSTLNTEAFAYDYGEWPDTVQHDLMNRFCDRVEQAFLTLPFEDVGGYDLSCGLTDKRLQRRKKTYDRLLESEGEGKAENFRRVKDHAAVYGRQFWDKVYDFGNYELGDCTFHSGWTIHAAPPAVTVDDADEQKRVLPREAVTVSFIQGEARKVPKDVWYRQYKSVAEEDFISYGRWFDKVEDGHVLETDILPVMWPREGNQSAAPAGDPEL